MKRILIIPGAGSSKLNWLDQFIEFEEQGLKTFFLDYFAEYHRDFFSLINESKYKLYEYFHLSIKKDDLQDIIVAHSMGAMKIVSILKDLTSSASKSKEDQFLLENLKKSKIVLVQMPILTKNQVLSSLKSVSGMASLMIKAHEPFKDSVSDFLSDFKLKSRFLPNPIKNIFDMLWILSAMHISAYTTPEKAFTNMVDFYDSWNLLESNIYQALRDFNIHMTVSNSDFFVDKEEALKFAEIISAKTKDFDWTFHNPMHFPWSQKEFNEWVIS
ncbi:MAG: hypothetical protein HRT47_12855 [Candidatus Caenarcaniphilales bacterium]|nr:hypothetical protein [Candidatus Caenarcaniphilales bacterium]